MREGPGDRLRNLNGDISRAALKVPEITAWF